MGCEDARAEVVAGALGLGHLAPGDPPQAGEWCQQVKDRSAEHFPPREVI